MCGVGVGVCAKVRTILAGVGLRGRDSISFWHGWVRDSHDVTETWFCAFAQQFHQRLLQDVALLAVATSRMEPFFCFPNPSLQDPGKSHPM